VKGGAFIFVRVNERSCPQVDVRLPECELVPQHRARHVPAVTHNRAHAKRHGRQLQVLR
jgi:hypothetical protein